MCGRTGMIAWETVADCHLMIFRSDDAVWSVTETGDDKSSKQTRH